MKRPLELPPFERPARVPDGVECRVAEPPVARAGEAGRWRFRFTLSESVPAGQEVRVLFDGGRNVKGAFRPIQVSDPAGAGFVEVRRASGEAVGPLALVAPGIVSFRAPGEGLSRGEEVAVDLLGAAGPRLSLPSKMVLLYLPAPDAGGNVPPINAEIGKRVIGACLIHATGADLAGLRVHAPSQAVAGEPLDLLVRGEDAYRNVAYKRPGELIVRLEGEILSGWTREEQEHSACAWLRGIVLPRPGVVRLEVEDAEHGLRATANPIRVVDAPEVGAPKHYWGMIHGHTELSDGAGTLDHYFTHMRDACALDFGALGDHDHLYETSDAMWAMAQEATRRYHDPGHFVTFLGYEWAKWRRNGDGDRNVYYLHDGRPMVRSDAGHSPTPADLFRALADEVAMVIPHHPANIGNHCDWKDHDPARERLVEIFSEWGSSERSIADGNPYEITRSPQGGGGPGSGEMPEGFVQRALALGWRVGFTAGGDDHQGHPGDLTLRGAHPPRAPGLLAVRAAARTRKAIWEALYRRDCYGTTGARIVVDFSLDGAPMGSELWLEERPALRERRLLKARVNGTAAVTSIEVVRNNQVVFTHAGAGADEAFEWEDTEPFDAIALPPAPHWPTSFCFYYLRVTQADGEMAWISPVWVSLRPVVG